MNVLVLLGSPHKNGTTAALAKSFCKGVLEAGHHVDTLHTPSLEIRACIGCNSCRNSGECIFDDDMKKLEKSLIEADMVVFVSPLYYFGFTAQLKTVIDRFYSINNELRSKAKKAVLLSAGADTDEWAMDGIVANYEVMCRYLHWENVGEILASGCGSPEQLAETDYEEKAFKLGGVL